MGKMLFKQAFYACALVYMYRFQMQHFRQELRDLKTRSSGLKAEVGSREEITRLKQATDGMGAYCSELKSATQVRSRDIRQSDSSVHCVCLALL